MARGKGQRAVGVDIIQASGGREVAGGKINGNGAGTAAAAGDSDDGIGYVLVDGVGSGGEIEDGFIGENRQRGGALARNCADRIGERQIDGFRTFHQSVVKDWHRKSFAQLAVGEDQ